MKIKFMTHNYKKYDGGTVESYLHVQYGIVEECQLFGEFMAQRPASEVAGQLVGCTFQYESVLNVLKHFKISDYFGRVNVEDVATCICCMDNAV